MTICEVFSGKIVKPIWKSSRSRSLERVNRRWRTSNLARFLGICPTAEVLASFAGSHNRLLAYFHWLNDFSKPLNFHAAVMRRFDADLADLVRRMLAKDSEKRISSTQCLMSDYYIKQKRAIENARVGTELISWRGDKVFSTRPMRRSTQRASFSGVWCGLKPKWPRVWPFSREKLAKVRPDTAGMIIVA